MEGFKNADGSFTYKINDSSYNSATNSQLQFSSMGELPGDDKGLKGLKFDSDKPRMDLLPMDALLEIAKVLSFGAKKYGDRNWEKGIDLQRLRASILRHDAATELGEELDPESGLLHRAHKACGCLMELALYLRKLK